MCNMIIPVNLLQITITLITIDEIKVIVENLLLMIQCIKLKTLVQKALEHYKEHTVSHGDISNLFPRMT